MGRRFDPDGAYQYFFLLLAVLLSLLVSALFLQGLCRSLFVALLRFLFFLCHGFFLLIAGVLVPRFYLLIVGLRRLDPR